MRTSTKLKSAASAVPLQEVEPVNPPCEVCGNHYPQAFSVVMEGRTHVFDCFECAIHQLAPVCGHCGCRIIGHGLQSGKLFFCCSHCARQSGEHAEAGEMLPMEDPFRSTSMRRL